MSWIDDLEQCKLYEWAGKHEGEFCFTQPDESKDTYYELFDNTDNCCEFGFNTVPEMVAELDKLWEGQPVFEPVKKICAVAAFKREPFKEEESIKGGKETIEIPDFVYAF